MNAMTHALQAAGVKTPTQAQRVWQAIKDSPRGQAYGLTAADIAAATKIDISSIYSVMHMMLRRDMVSATRADGVYRYTAVGNTYELKPAKRKVQIVPIPSPALAMPYTVVQATKNPHGVDLDKLTLGQIKALLADIQALFTK